MPKLSLLQKLLALTLFLAFSLVTTAQTDSSIPYRSQEVSEEDGMPVLVKHLPAWELQKGNFTFTARRDELIAAVGDRPVLHAIDFVPGTEAVSARYESGTLVLIEFASPQTAADASYNIINTLADTGDTSTVYRRIGNYNALVFDPHSKAAANSLLDEIKYEKQIHWLGDNPFRISAERAFLSTVLFIVMGAGFAVAIGLISGTVYFRLRERRRAAMTTHTDAGGMTRLNLDGLTPEIIPNQLLKD
jgi:hypothetical protein